MRESKHVDWAYQYLNGIAANRAENWYELGVVFQLEVSSA